MKYDIHVTEKAEADINAALDYIEFKLMNPQAADNLMAVIEKEINTLSESPYAHQIVDDPVLKKWGFRYLLVKSYIAFFVIDEESKTVYVIRFLYGKRNWIRILKSQVIDPKFFN